MATVAAEGWGPGVANQLLLTPDSCFGLPELRLWELPHRGNSYRLALPAPSFHLQVSPLLENNLFLKSLLALRLQGTEARTLTSLHA